MTTKLYDLALYTKDGNEHSIRIDDETLAVLERNLDKDRQEHFTQVYCYDDDSVVCIRMESVELYTVKDAEVSE